MKVNSNKNSKSQKKVKKHPPNYQKYQ